MSLERDTLYVDDDDTKIEKNDETSTITSPFDLFVADCCDLEPQIQIQTIKKLPVIVLALGIDETKNKLIPFLNRLIEGDVCDDEILLHLAVQLGDLLPVLGGPENAELLLNVLEKLASTEEPVVRENSVRSIQKIGKELNESQLESTFFPMVFKMAETQWFSAKMSATGLFAIRYRDADQLTKEQLRNAYRNLCEDESFLVRRAAALKSLEMIQVLDEEDVKDFVAIFEKFCNDEQDSVRMLAAEVGMNILRKLKIEEIVLNKLLHLFDDPSWKVRFEAASLITSLQKILGQELTQIHLIPIYQNLVHDRETQVRRIAAKNIAVFCERLHEDCHNDETCESLKHLMIPLIKDLNDDDCLEVRDAIASVLTTLVPVMGKQITKDMLLPIITSISDDTPKAKEAILNNLNAVIASIGLEDISETALEIIGSLSDPISTNWRTRRTSIVTILLIAEHYDREYFDKNIRELYFRLLSDSVYAVRRTAPLLLPVFVKLFGSKWAEEIIIPELLKFAEHPNYLHRFVTLFCIDELIHPTLDVSKSLLGEVQTKIDKQMLQKIKNLNNTLTERLQETWVTEAFEILNNHYVCEDNINTYAENTVTILKKEHSVEILAISKGETYNKKKDSYLEGILNICNDHFLPILADLAEDRTVNVKAKVGRTLRKIIVFNATLENELETEWVEKSLKCDEN